MRRLLIVAASAVALFAIGIGAVVAFRGEAGPEPGGEPEYIFRIGPATVTTFQCGAPPYKPCPGDSSGSEQTGLRDE
jgi:hypothetical protein